ncbi:hypothetical protein GPJ56_007679 [Histomonas meleagridis]|uniref:uncharacterized protein n=1 Tax=Histomonas meleagridis TaxID=135588 RepID=UPI00355AB018|nr:hypothetical protein GPJ56_007679 [Histomonas meleagridis]KAH0805872.1 hypothetical protein GO595_001306 [Histomonas meleagridis]
MGQDQSLPAQSQTQKVQPETHNVPQENKVSESEEPFIHRNHTKIEYPKDIQITSGLLPLTDEMASEYYKRIINTINKNEELLSSTVKKQLEEYIKMAQLLEKRKNELDGRLASMLSSFRKVDNEVKETTELLKLQISRAEALAEELDPTIPKFKDFNK